MENHLASDVDTSASDRTQQIVEKINSLKPQPVLDTLWLVIFIAAIFIFNYMTDNGIFEDKYYLLILMVFIVSSFYSNSGKKTNKRIDLLIELILEKK